MIRLKVTTIQNQNDFGLVFEEVGTNTICESALNGLKDGTYNAEVKTYELCLVGGMRINESEYDACAILNIILPGYPGGSKQLCEKFKPELYSSKDRENLFLRLIHRRNECPGCRTVVRWVPLKIGDTVSTEILAAINSGRSNLDENRK